MDLTTVRRQLGSITWSGGWSRCRTAEEAALAAQLQRELQPGHALFGRGCTALAHDAACHKVLFFIGPPEPTLAVVSLTWQVPRGEGAFPWVTPYASLDQWVASIAA